MADSSRGQPVLLRAPSGSSTLSSGSSGGPLPPGFVEGAQQRLRMTVTLCTAGLLVYATLYVTAWRDDAILWVNALSWFGAVVGIGILVWLRLRPPTLGGVTRAGILFHLVFGFMVAMAESLTLPASSAPAQLGSWMPVNILLLPIVVPGSPRTILKTGLVLASLGPLIYGIGTALGVAPAHGWSFLFTLWFPGYMFSVVAMVPSKVMMLLRRQVARARRMGAYQLIEKLGAGAMGEVWRAEHSLLARPAAVKLIKAGLLGRDPEQARRTLARFTREAQVTATLESPHTVELYDFGVAEDGTFYLVMELLRGQDLETVVRELGPMPPARVIHLLTQMCDSLGDAHERGLVHRDVKPANVFVGRRGRRYDYVRVVDFGLVKNESPTESQEIGLTQDGQIQGTPAYMAPEAAVETGELDHRADLYALGCVGYFLLTGKLVFEAESPMQVVVMHVTEDPVPPSAVLGRSLPDGLEEAILACLQKEPDDRPQSAEALAGRLAQITVDEGWDDRAAEAWWRENRPDVVVEAAE